MKRTKVSEMSARQAFFKAMLYTICAVALLLIGYFTAHFLFGTIA